MNISHMHVYDILRTLAVEADSYLGIGVQEGKCVENIVMANPKIRLALCDTWGPHHGGTNRGSHGHIDEMLRNRRFEGTCLFLDGKSQELIPQLNDTFDLIFVDGDHLEQPAYEDLVNCWPICMEYMVVHDTHMPPVMAALKRFMSEYDAKYSESQDGTGTWVIER